MKQKSLFYKIYFSVITVFVALLVIMLVWLNGWLKSYEASQPETIINGIIEEYVNKNNIYGISNIAPLNISQYETAESINTALSALTNGKTVTASSSATKIDGCDLAYTIKADDQKIINVYLKKTESSSSLLAKYEIIKIDLADGLYKTFKVLMPNGASVLINGTPLATDSIKALELPQLPQKYTAGASAGNYAEITNLIGNNINITATLNGAPLTVIQNGTQYTVTQNIGDDTVAKITGFAEEASKTYSAYMQNDSSMTAIRKYFATGTEFYENLRTSQVIFALDHNGYRFEDVKSHDFYKLSDNLYSCRVTLTQVLIKGGSEYKDYFDKNVYIYTDGNNMSVIDLRSSGETK